LPTLELSDWATLYLADKPAALANNNAIDALYTTLMSGARSSYNILHISDLNVDYNYVEGTRSDCSDLVCCQAKHGIDGIQAAKYGNENCDTPSVTVSDILTSVNSVYPPDFVLITGALVSRDPSLTLAQRTTSFDTTINSIKTKFPTVPIIIALGNTEFSGTNS
jgi:hypothetical protein